MSWITDGLKDVGQGVIDTLNDWLKASGEWTASLLDTGIRTYNKFIDVAVDTLSRDIKDVSFGDFWEILDYVNNVFAVISSVVIVFLFTWSMFNVSMQHKSEVDIVTVLYDFAKFVVGIFLVTHAIEIVVAIFQLGTGIAKVSIGSINDNFVLSDPNRGLSFEYRQLFELGVSGLLGLIVTIMAIVGAVVMVACAVMILFEIYKRFFKMFCLMPFSSFSLATFIMADGQGNEIFKGYIKNVVATAFEVVVIILCLAFSSTLSNSDQNGFMASLFDIEDDLNLREVTIENNDDLNAFTMYCSTYEQINDTQGVKLFANSEVMDNIAADIQFEMEGNKYSSTLGSFDFYYIVPGETVTVDSETFSVNFNYPIKGYVGNELGLGSALLLILQCVVPMILTAVAVQQAPTYCSKAFGM